VVAFPRIISGDPRDGTGTDCRTGMMTESERAGLP